MLQTLTSSRGMVTVPHHLAAQAGLSVLREGGNAIEAVVAAAATIAVVYPHMNSIGGDGFWLIGEPGKAPLGIDACGRAAERATPGFYRERGCAAIPSRGPWAANTVAGAISGWQAALATSDARLPLSRLLADATWYARYGVPVTGSQQAYTTKFLAELHGQPGFAAAYLDAGRPAPAGALRRYPALAATLEQLAREGLDDFYRGGIAQALADDFQRLDCPLSGADLQRHTATRVEPLTVALGAGSVHNLPPPTQGLASLMILGIFDRLHCAAADGYAHLHGLIEATKQAFLVRNRHVCEPQAMTVAPESFLSTAALDERARAIDPARARPWPELPAKGDTVWMGAVDGSGRMVSYIQSVYWEFGSGVVPESLGSAWQNRGSSFSLDPRSHLYLEPGRRPFHTLNPAYARLADGRTMVYGTMGGDGQPQTQAAIFSRYAMFGQQLQQAITAPRWLLGRTWGQESVTLKLESRIPEAVVQQLARAGHDLEMVDDYSDQVGHAGALVVHPNGVISGAADPRSDGAVAGF
ncbi:MAG: gamma-glutamyltransferase [Casimicrobiaceae bacterium]